MTHSFAFTWRLVRAGCIAAGLLAGSVPAANLTALAADLSNVSDPLPLRVQSSVTINADVIRLGDLFVGDLIDPDKVVAQAPLPGQRAVLSPEWLTSLARNNGLSWRASTPYDRAVVFHPGQVVPADDILAAVKTALVSRGMPANFALKTSVPLSPVTIAQNTAANIAVREAFFDAASNAFTALVELPAGDPRAQFVPLNGSVFAAVMAPVLKQALPRDTVITADMVEMTALPEDKLQTDTILDMNVVVGLATRGYVRSGQALRDSDLHHIALTRIPVLRSDVRRGAEIVAAQVMWTEVNANQLPDDAILDDAHLIGQTPKRFIPAGTPIRNGDVQALNLIEIPVAARDMPRGTTLTADDLRWIVADMNTMPGEVIKSDESLIGYIVKHTIRAGQPFRPLSVALPVVVTKGSLVTLVYNNPIMQLTAKAKTLENGAVGQIIRIVNTKSNTTLFAEVVDAQTVRVTQQQTAMN